MGDRIWFLLWTPVFCFGAVRRMNWITGVRSLLLLGEPMGIPSSVEAAERLTKQWNSVEGGSGGPTRLGVNPM